MGKKCRQKAVAMILALTIFIGSTGTSVQANFADDWAGQTTSTDTGYFKGGERGYLSGGSFSARWPMGTDSAMSISLPSVKAGCGGIDMFLGGFSFLDTDKLVEKFQRILSAAPAAAFDIALKTLSPQTADTIKSLEAMVEKLNNLQLDDCKAAKALVSVPMSLYNGPGKEALEAQTTAAISDFKVSSGYEQDWKTNLDGLTDNFGKMFSSNPVEAATAKNNLKGDMAASISSCPAVLVEILATDGSVLSKLGARRGIPAEYMDQLKAYIGDVAVTTDSGKPKAIYQQPCTGVTYSSMMEGTSKKMSGNTYTSKESTHCVAPASPIVSLKQKTTDAINKGLVAMKSKAPLDPADAALLRGIPLTVMSSLAVGVQSGMETMVVQKLSTVAANAMAYQLISDLIALYYQADSEYKRVLANQGSSTDPKACNKTMFDETTLAMLELAKAAESKQDEAYKMYAQKTEEGIAIGSLMAELEKFREQTRKIVGEIFGSAVARRATGA